MAEKAVLGIRMNCLEQGPTVRVTPAGGAGVPIELRPGSKISVPFADDLG